MADTAHTGNQLWEEFLRTRSVSARRKLIMQYLDLVRYVVSRLGKPAAATGKVLDMNDMLQYGVIGLTDAIERFSPVGGAKFETFAVPRIRGAILDQLRALDWVPRSVRANARRVERTIDKISQETGAEAGEQEIARRLSMSLEELQKILAEASCSISNTRSTMDEDGDAVSKAPEPSPDPVEEMTDHQCKMVLVEAVGALPERERTVIALYYYEGLKFGDIARVLRVSESRISQIHAEVLRGLRQRLADFV